MCFGPSLSMSKTILRISVSPLYLSTAILFTQALCHCNLLKKWNLTFILCRFVTTASDLKAWSARGMCSYDAKEHQPHGGNAKITCRQRQTVNNLRFKSRRTVSPQWPLRSNTTKHLFLTLFSKNTVIYVYIYMLCIYICILVWCNTK